MAMNLEKLWLALQRCQMQLAVDLVAPWVECAVAGEVELLIDACPVALRPRLALLLGDLMGGWPRGVWGVPVLMLAVRCAETPAGARRVVLPGPSGERGVAEGVSFAGWLDKGTLLPVQGLLGGDQRLAEVSVKVGAVDAAIAVFRAEAGVDAGLIQIPVMFWAEVLAGMPVELRMSAGAVSERYAGALEVAGAMWRAAGGAGVGRGEIFVTRSELAAGVAVGQVFAGARMS